MLGPPIRKGGLVPRPALLARISAEAPRLAVIQAAAGFGKTSLLSQLHESLRGASPASVWLGLDPADNAYSRFLVHLIGTLESIGIRVHKTLKGAVERGGCPDPATARELLNRAIADLDRRFIICIDDHHRLTDPRSQQLLSDLILAAHERLSWIITTRSTQPAREPPAPFKRNCGATHARSAVYRFRVAGVLPTTLHASARS